MERIRDRVRTSSNGSNINTGTFSRTRQNLNGYIECFMSTLKSECNEQIEFFGGKSLDRVLTGFVARDDEERNQKGSTIIYFVLEALPGESREESPASIGSAVCFVATTARPRKLTTVRTERGALQEECAWPTTQRAVVSEIRSSLSGNRSRSITLCLDIHRVHGVEFLLGLFLPYGLI